MAASPDSSSNHHHSPRGPDSAVNSPRSRRKNLPSPWAQVVRGEPEASPSPNPSQSLPPSTLNQTTTPPPLSMAAEQSPSSPHKSVPAPATAPAQAASPSSPPESGSEESAEGSKSNVVSVQPKKPAWNKPSNDALDLGPVMGDAVSWPALSESARASPKSSSTDSSFSKAAPVGSVSNLQGPALPQSPQKLAASSALSPNSTSTNSPTARQKLNKRGVGGNGGSTNAYTQGGFAQHPIPPPPPPPLPPFPVFQMPPNAYGSFMPPIANTTVRDSPYKGNNWDGRPGGGFVPQPHGMADHRNSSRRGNSGPHHRGDGSCHNNSNANRRDKDRGNFAGARDVNLQPHRANPRGFMRHSPPPPASPPFVGPQPVRPFVPMGYDMTSQFYLPTMPVEPYTGGPFFTHAPPAPMFVPVAEPPLPVLLVRQIEYYFSDDNLVKDDYLKSHMDKEGWVPIALIATFPRVMSLTNNIALISDSLKTSTVVEVQDNRVRRRNEWSKWICYPVQLASDRGSPSSRSSSYEELAASFEKMTAEEATANQNNITGKSDPYHDAVSRYSPKPTDQVQHPGPVSIDNAC